jgi:pimeloyl-ACP methyl ester carboxylesterase
LDIRTGFAETNGAKLYYEVAGAGEPVVFVHGFTLDTRMWDDQFEAFAERYQVMRYDVRGFGKSSIPDGTSYSRSDDMMAILSHLGISHAHVIGLSMGAMISLDFALEYPNAVDSLVLVDGPPSGWKMPLAFRKLLNAPSETAKASGVEAALKVWMDSPLFKPAMSNPEVAPKLAEIVPQYSGWHWLNDNPVRLAVPPAVERLDEVKAPTLIIMGEHDLTDFHMVAETMRHEIPNARKSVMMGVGHMANMEDPERFNDLVLRFLQSL